MPAHLVLLTVTPEDLLARLTSAAYRVALEGGLKGPFLDVELSLWRELGAVLRDVVTGPAPTEGNARDRRALAGVA